MKLKWNNETAVQGCSEQIHRTRHARKSTDYLHRWSAIELGKFSQPTGALGGTSLPAGKHSAFQIWIAKTKVWRHHAVAYPLWKLEVTRTLCYMVRTKALSSGFSLFVGWSSKYLTCRRSCTTWHCFSSIWSESTWAYSCLSGPDLPSMRF